MLKYKAGLLRYRKYLRIKTELKERCKDCNKNWEVKIKKRFGEL